MKHDLPFKPQRAFAQPSTDFQSVRDGRRSTLFFYDVDLSSARSIAAGTHATIPIAGNVFFADPLYDLVGASLAGIARVHFQDTNLNPAGTPLTVLPTTLLKIPFTQLLIENYAQAGKFLRILYGVDVDLQPGASQQVQATIIGQPVQVSGTLAALAQAAIGGVNALQVTHRGLTYGAAYKTTTALAANTSDTIFSAAANINGAILWRCACLGLNGTAVPTLSIAAHTAAPNGVATGDVLNEESDWKSDVSAAFIARAHVSTPVAIPAGKGVYVTNSVAETGAHRSALYTLL